MSNERLPPHIEPYVGSDMSINWWKLADDIHAANVNKGFWPNNRNFGELLMLIVSETAEFIEGWDTGEQDKHLPQYANWEVELADTAIRLLDAVGYYCTHSELEQFFKNDVAEFDVPSMVSPSATENAMLIVRLLALTLEAHRKGEDDYKRGLMLTLYFVLELLDGTPSNFHTIFEKVAFNKNRPHMHGKKY